MLLPQRLGVCVNCKDIPHAAKGSSTFPPDLTYQTRCIVWLAGNVYSKAMVHVFLFCRIWTFLAATEKLRKKQIQPTRSKTRLLLPWLAWWHYCLSLTHSTVPGLPLKRILRHPSCYRRNNTTAPESSSTISVKLTTGSGKTLPR